ncbi:hypothetical protein AB0G74_32480 [Streptomyces sp. NPDC020875]|uniref:hypothetical protein n=1 Tax=Streptomyces sp. NPDC020875 TaxID=3154898 RepID=UPI0033F29EF4
MNPTPPRHGTTGPEGQARQLINAVESVYAAPTAYRDPAPLPRTGDTPPVPQPGRPPMSQRATDISGIMLAAGAASLPIGGVTSLVLYTLGTVDPAALALGAAAPVALVLAAASLLRAAGQARRDTRTEHHHHYSGPVRQTHQTTTTRGVIARTTNQHDH